MIISLEHNSSVHMMTFMFSSIILNINIYVEYIFRLVFVLLLLQNNLSQSAIKLDISKTFSQFLN